MLPRLGLIAIWGLLSVANGDAAETRVALIIGNAHYANAQLTLVNPTNDASAMQRALHDAGFDTILKLNATRRDIYRAVDEFSAKIGRDPHAVGLFYYAGHGVQADGTNFLIPVDAEIESEADLDANAYDIAKVLQGMKRAQNDINIVILDACRNNPLPRTRGIDRGLARINAPSGTFIAYAAAPGEVAQDGASGSNGVFTGELIKAMALPNVPLEQMFKKVIIGVKADTHGKQQPWSEASVQGDFYFHPSAYAAAVTHGSIAPAPTAAALTYVPTPAELDEQYWDDIKNSKDAVDFASYTKNFPRGLHHAAAELMLRRLTPPTKVVGGPAPTPHNPAPQLISSLPAAMGQAQTPLTKSTDGLAAPMPMADSRMLRANSPIALQIEETLVSGVNTPGSRFKMKVAEDIRVDDAVVIPAGTAAFGEIIDSQKQGSLGKNGVLVMSARFIHLGQRDIPLHSAIGAAGRSDSIGASFVPFVHGKNATVDQGTVVVVRTAADERF